MPPFGTANIIDIPCNNFLTTRKASSFKVALFSFSAATYLKTYPVTANPVHCPPLSEYAYRDIFVQFPSVKIVDVEKFSGM